MTDGAHIALHDAGRADRIRSALARGDAVRLQEALGGQWPAALADALALARGPEADPVRSLADIRRALGARPGGTSEPWLDLTAGSPERFVAMTQFGATDKPGTVTPTALRLSAGKGERARFIVPELPGRASFQIHALIGIENVHGVAPVLALRLLHGNDAEEIILTFRANRLVIDGMVEREIDWTAGPRLLSVSVAGEALRVDVDGIAVWYAPRRRSDAASGINLDLIGVAGGEVAVDLYWVSIGPVERAGLDAGLDAAQTVFESAIAAAGADLALDLEAYRLVPTRERAVVAQAIEAVGAHPTVYLEHVVERLSERLGDSGNNGDVRRDAPRLPVVKIENVAVELPTDASAKSLVGLVMGKQKATLSILRDVSFSAYSGDIIGIIGKNGAGKSTLLRSIIGAIPISKGSITVRGKPVLLRPGAGMQSELTGRENILLAGLYMGLTPREVDGIIDDVIAFSELGEHIDRPYQYYSDGMRARLVFALATSISPELLMLDELLSAGDIGFQEKAARRLDTFIRNAKVVFVVQHGTDFVMSRCTKCLYIRGGRQAFFGDPRIAVEMYQSDI